VYGFGAVPAFWGFGGDEKALERQERQISNKKEWISNNEF
jgi:hypothetical protein